MITPRLITPTALDAQANAEIAVRQDTARAAFIRQLSLIRQMSLSNQLMSGLNTNYRIILYPEDDFSAGFNAVISPCAFENQFGLMCACQNSFSCAEIAGFYALDYNFQNTGIFTRNESRLKAPIPGLVATCIPLESLLASSLACLYNTTCIAQIFRSDSLIEKLDAAKASRYEINSTVESIIEQLMIEQWTVNISFAAYFAQCNPTWCNYTTASRVTPLYVVTTLLGFYGGLTVSLRLRVPQMILLLFVHLFNRHNAAERVSFIGKHNSAFLFVRIYLFTDRAHKFVLILIHLNLFATTDHTVEIEGKQRWMTRIYIALLISEYN